jgi:hypothetical protein
MMVTIGIKSKLLWYNSVLIFFDYYDLATREEVRRKNLHHEYCSQGILKEFRLTHSIRIFEAHLKTMGIRAAGILPT